MTTNSKGYMQEWYRNNADRVKKNMHEYYLTNKEKIKASKKEYRKNYRDRFGRTYQEYSRDYWKKNIEGLKRKAKRYRLKHREILRLKAREWNKKYGNRFLVQWKLKAFTALGGKCIRCGFSDVRALQIDHVNGSTKSERRMMGHSYYYKKVLASTSGEYQLLCANCNWIKRYEEGRINGNPHRKATAIKCSVCARFVSNQWIRHLRRSFSRLKYDDIKCASCYHINVKPRKKQEVKL